MIKSSNRIYARNEWGSGSVGGFFQFAGDDNVYGMTCKHVIADAADLSPGDVTVYAKGTRQNLGVLKTWARLLSDGLNYLDIALFALNSGVAFDWLTPGGDIPIAFDKVAKGDRVAMILQNGQTQDGVVTMNPINYQVPAIFEAGQTFQFAEMIEIQGTDGETFSDPGDSGSLIFNNANAIIGVLMGTDPSGTKSYAIPFQNGRHGIDQSYQLTIASNNLNT